MADKDINTEKEIDLLELGQKIWNKRSLIFKACLIGFVIGIIIAFSIPKEYATTVILAPEAKSSTTGNMGALAAMAGINLQQSSEDVISPEIYPDIIKSTPFLIGLFNIQIKTEKEGIDTNLYTYLNEGQKIPWWSYIFKFPSKIKNLFSSKNANNSENMDRKNEVNLSFEEFSILDELKNRISISVNKKTGIISLNTTMQNPQISALIADTVTSYLQEYIITYRTQKARQDLVFTQKLYEEAKEDYYKAQQEYTTYTDKNLDIVSARYGATKERLQNEVTLSYGVYNQMAQQLQMAKVKVQDITPVYTIIQPAVVPLIPDKPNKKVIVIGFVFIAFIVSCVWVLGKEFLKK